MLKLFGVLLLSFIGSVSVGLTIQGCGDSDAQTAAPPSTSAQSPAAIRREVFAYEEPTPEYTEMLEKLKSAAAAGETYEAARLAQRLGPVEKSVLGWFCETAWQMVVNSELDRLPDAEYLAHRLSVRAILELSNSLYTKSGRAPYLDPVAVAVDELDSVIDLQAVDGAVDRSYNKTCYAGGNPGSSS